MRRALSDIADQHRGETVLVVSHGGALSVALPALCGTPGPPPELGNCDGALVEQDADGWALRTWGQLPSGSPA
jgi:broad specificity phosphatase PhoE